MKKQQLKKLSAFIIMMIFSFTYTNAQIIYTDVIPDATYSGSNDSCYLDLDNNGQADYLLITKQIPYHCGSCLMATPEYQVLIVPVATNVIAYVTYYSIQWPQCLQAGQVIGAGLSMSASNGKIRSAQPGGTCSIGPFPGNCVPAPSITWDLAWIQNPGPRYLGLRFDIAGATHYGWARLTTSSATSFTLMDYAYNSIPNQPILAGQTIATGIIENSFASSINLFPNPANNHLTIVLPITNKKVEVSITDITGKIIYTTTAIETKNIVVSTKYFAAGIYNVQIQTEDFIATKKLVVEK